MSPTAELRFVERYVGNNDTRLILQQKWVQHHIPTGETQAPHEWRDVPLVVEQPREHKSSADCWCNPELNYVDPVTGAEVWVHKEPQ